MEFVAVARAWASCDAGCMVAALGSGMVSWPWRRVHAMGPICPMGSTVKG
jgi:hypothetical protein